METENQPDTNIAQLVEEAVGEILKAEPALKDFERPSKALTIMRAILKDHGRPAELLAAIAADPSFGDLRDGWLQKHDGSGIQVQNLSLAMILIESAIDGGSVESLIKDARAFAKYPKSSATFYAPLTNVTVTAPINLRSDVDLIPWADVPEGYQKEAFEPHSLIHPRLFSSPPAASAIRIRYEEQKVLFSSLKDADVAVTDRLHKIYTRSGQVNDVVACITASAPCAVTTLGSWTELDKKFANKIPGGSYSASHTGLSDPSSKTVELDGQAVARLWGNFERFESTHKKAMQVALHRLCQAVRRSNIVDRAIDLGIALEILLLHDPKNKGGYQGELKYRFAIRGAALLGGDKPERLENFELLKEAYDLRSKAVHSGELKPKIKNRLTKETLEQATDVCAQIARMLIDRGSFPNWEEDYVIGGET